MLEQPPLTFYPTSISSENSMLTYHPMTGYDYGDAIVAIGRGYGAYSLWFSYRSGLRWNIFVPICNPSY